MTRFGFQYSSFSTSFTMEKVGFQFYRPKSFVWFSMYARLHMPQATPELYQNCANALHSNFSVHPLWHRANCRSYSVQSLHSLLLARHEDNIKADSLVYSCPRGSHSDIIGSWLASELDLHKQEMRIRIQPNAKQYNPRIPTSSYTTPSFLGTAGHVEGC